MSLTERSRINAILDDALLDLALLLEKNNVVIDDKTVSRDTRINNAVVSMRAAVNKSREALAHK